MGADARIEIPNPMDCDSEELDVILSWIHGAMATNLDEVVENERTDLQRRGCTDEQRLDQMDVAR